MMNNSARGEPTGIGGLQVAAGGLVAGGVFVAAALSMFKKCPPNKIMVVYGMGQNRIVSHGGAWVLPQLQMHQFLSLEPVALDIPLKGALSLEKIRVNVPSVFTYAVGKGEGIKQNAAERLLGLEPHQIDHQAEEIIIGQMRGVLASLTIEQINRDREAFITEVQEHCAVELNKLGLVLLNTNVQNITDDSGVIDALGRKAAETARQEALVDVATAERMGEIGISEQKRQQDITVSENMKEREIGVRGAMREQEVRLQQLEAEELVEVNLAKTKKAESDAHLAARSAEFSQMAQIAEKEAVAAISRADAVAQTLAAEARGKQNEADIRADVEAKANAEKAKMIVDASAKAEEAVLIANGQAAAQFAIADAAARAEFEMLSKKAAGFKAIVDACGGSDQAYRMMLLDHLDVLAETSATAISNIKFDKVVVWDGAGGGGKGGDAVPNFIRGIAGSLPPTLEVLKDIAGVDLQLPGMANKSQPDMQAITQMIADAKGEVIGEAIEEAKAETKNL